MIKIQENKDLYFCCYPYDDDGNFNLNILKYHYIVVAAINEAEAFNMWKDIQSKKHKNINNQINKMIIININDVSRKVYITDSEVVISSIDVMMQHISASSSLLNRKP